MEKQLISVKEAAKMTGISESWWRQAVRGKKNMPPVRVRHIGHSIRLHLGDLVRFIEDGGEVFEKKRGPGRPRKKKPENN